MNYGKRRTLIVRIVAIVCAVLLLGSTFSVVLSYLY